MPDLPLSHSPNLPHPPLGLAEPYVCPFTAPPKLYFGKVPALSASQFAPCLITGETAHNLGLFVLEAPDPNSEEHQCKTTQHQRLRQHT